MSGTSSGPQNPYVLQVGKPTRTKLSKEERKKKQQDFENATELRRAREAAQASTQGGEEVAAEQEAAAVEAKNVEFKKKLTPKELAAKKQQEREEADGMNF